MGKKYRTEKDLKTGLLRIIALKDFADVKEGDKGGLIEKEDNLSQEGNCWVYDYARVYGHARVYENAKLYDSARVFDCAEVYEDAVVCGCTQIYGDAKVYGEARIGDYAWVYGRARVDGDVCVYDNARVFGDAEVSGNAKVWGNAEIYGKVSVGGNVGISGNDVVCWAARVCSNVSISNVSIKDSKNYAILATRNKKFRIFSSNIKDKNAKSMKNIDITGLDYIKNIQTIRQIYETEVYN